MKCSVLPVHLSWLVLDSYLRDNLYEIDGLVYNLQMTHRDETQSFIAESKELRATLSKQEAEEVRIVCILGTHLTKTV